MSASQQVDSLGSWQLFHTDVCCMTDGIGTVKGMDVGIDIATSQTRDIADPNSKHHP